MTYGRVSDSLQVVPVNAESHKALEMPRLRLGARPSLEMTGPTHEYGRVPSLEALHSTGATPEATRGEPWSSFSGPSGYSDDVYSSLFSARDASRRGKVSHQLFGMPTIQGGPAHSWAEKNDSPSHGTIYPSWGRPCRSATEDQIWPCHAPCVFRCLFKINGDYPLNEGHLRSTGTGKLREDLIKVRDTQD